MDLQVFMRCHFHLWSPEKSFQINSLEVDPQVTLCMKPKISKTSMVYLLSTKAQRYSSREKSLFKKWCCKKKERNAAIKTGYLHAKKDDSPFMTHTILKKKTESGTETESSKRKHGRKSWIGEDRWDADEMHNSLRKKMMNWTSSKLKTSTLWETLLRKQEDKPQTRSK